jgi:rfaE bifunctional protein nucleotidyltransferase chain/domain
MGRGPLPPRSSLQNYNGQDVTYSTEHKIITREEAARWVRELQTKGLKVVFTNGCFDLLHPGHVAYLEEARSLGDALLVAVNTDASVRRLGKGGLRPVNPEADRARVLAALAAVDRVVLFEEDTPLALITELQPDILVKGGDYQMEGVVGREVVLARGGQVRILPFRAGYSSSLLVERLRSSGD